MRGLLPIVEALLPLPASDDLTIALQVAVVQCVRPTHARTLPLELQALWLRVHGRRPAAPAPTWTGHRWVLTTEALGGPGPLRLIAHLRTAGWRFFARE